MVSYVWLQKETEEGLGKTRWLYSQVLEQEVRPAMQDHMEEHGQEAKDRSKGEPG